jgi:predicted AAA+ superfamily ATPase
MTILKRKAYEKLRFWKNNKKQQGLLVTGARQVGKTFLIQEFARQHYQHIATIDLIEDQGAAASLDNALDTADILARISLLARTTLVPGKTLIFIDEVQKSKNVITAIKYLVQQSDYDFILSGSLLGVELKDVRSVPIGYLDTVQMFPLDFEEFCWANGVAADVLKPAKAAFDTKTPVPDYLHERLLRLFYEFLIVGGMPQAVEEFIDTKNLQQVRSIQQNIIFQHKADISQYSSNEALIIKDIYDLIPSELNQQNKRFVLKALNEHARFNRYARDFVWLTDAGAAIPVFLVDEPKYPLKLSKSTNLFKLFMNDVGLLTSTFFGDVSLDILNKRKDVNYGAIYENAVACELVAHGVDPYFYNNKKRGELDFVLETPLGSVTVIEVKSGKDYKRHVALSNIIDVQNYKPLEAIVLCEKNIEQGKGLTYMPIYCAMWIGRQYE